MGYSRALVCLFVLAGTMIIVVSNFLLFYYQIYFIHFMNMLARIVLSSLIKSWDILLLSHGQSNQGFYCLPF